MEQVNPSPACSAFAKLQAAYDDPMPVRLTPGEAASIYRSLRNCGVTAEFAANYAAGIGCDTSWQCRPEKPPPGAESPPHYTT